MQLDDKALNFIKNAKAAGATIDQVADFLRSKGYEFEYNPEPAVQEEQPDVEQNLQAPGIIKGTSRSFATGATGGLAPWIAGLTNINARAAGAVAAAIADRDLATLKQLDPRRYSEYYEEGKREYTDTQKAFSQEHPIANVVGETAGTLGGIALTGGTLGAATKGAVAATKVGQAGLPGMLAARTAGEAATFAAYDAVRGATEGDDLSIKGAATGAAKGGALGVAFGILGGGMQAAEPGLIQQAQKMISNPAASKLLVKSLGLGVEGATIGAVPAAIEGRAPNAKDILAGEAFAAGGRGLAWAGSKGGQALWKFANTPTKMKAEEIRATAEGKSEPVAKETKYRIEPTEEEISARMNEYKGNKYMTKDSVKSILEGEMRSGVARAKLDPNAGLPFKERVLRSAKELTSKVIQQFNWARPVEEAVLNVEGATGKKVDAIDNPVETINTLRSGGEQEALIRPVLKKVESVEKEYKGSAAGARQLLLAEKEVQFAKMDGREPSERAIATIEAFKDNAPVQEIAKEVRDLNQKVLDKLLESGRIDRATYEEWKANDKYVPSWAEKIGEFGEQNVANNAQNFFRKYKGEALSYENPILSSMAQAKYLDQFATMQKAKKQYLKLAQLSGDVSLEETLEGYKGGKVKFDKAKQIVVWEDGKPQIWNVPERVANYFNPAPLPPASKVEKFLKGLAAMPLRFYKGGTTAASLGFAESNIPRDVAGAIIGSQWGGNISTSMLASSTKDLVNKAPITEPFSRQFGNQTMRSVEQLPGLAEDNVKRFSDMYESIQKGTKEGTPSNIFARMFATVLPNAAKKYARMASGASRKGLEMLSYAGNLSEETTRLAVFKSVLQGKAKNAAEYDLWMRRPDLIPQKYIAEAGKESREVTLNFRRQMAPWVEISNKYFMPYFKPAILGAMRGMTILTNPEIAPRAWRYIINTGIAQGLVLGNIVDDKQKEELNAINNEIIGKNFVFRGDNGRFYTVPMAQELAPIIKLFSSATEKMYRNATRQQRDDIGRETIQSLKDMFENYAPAVGYLNTPSNLVIGGPIPKTIVEERVNKDFFTGTPIESKGQLGRPAYLRQTKNTPALAVQLSKTLARNGINVSPLRLRHISVGLASNVAKELFSVTDSVMSTFGVGPLRSKKEVTDSPYTRRFIADITAPYNQYAQDTNEIIEAAKQGHKAMDSYDQEDWSEKQRKNFEMQEDIYGLIKDDVDNLQSLYKYRADSENDLFEEAEGLKKQYKNKEITRAEYLKKWRELESQMKELTEELALEERAYQLNIIAAAKEVKESYKKAPK